jgi:hypothetical protein
MHADTATYTTLLTVVPPTSPRASVLPSLSPTGRAPPPRAHVRLLHQPAAGGSSSIRRRRASPLRALDWSSSSSTRRGRGSPHPRVLDWSSSSSSTCCRCSMLVNATAMHHLAKNRAKMGREERICRFSLVRQLCPFSVPACVLC